MPPLTTFSGNQMKAIQKAMEQVQEAKRRSELLPHAINEDSYVKVSEDKMTAWLYLCPPPPGAPAYNRDDIIKFLQEKGVTKGYHQSNISAMAKKGVYEREICVARGKLPVEGRNGRYDYLFSPVVHSAPAIKPDGSVDYSNMSMLQNVHAGDVVARYIQAVPGENGYTVVGQELRTKPSRELALLRGKGVVASEVNPNDYLASIDGKIELKNGRIDIIAVHEIRGDVDLITGKIEFFGDVIITGNVSTGVLIRAGRNIVIKGTCEAVTLFAGGDIILARGIQGAKKAKISARGNIFADFIEHATVEAGLNVKANSIINSDVSAGEKVILTGKWGSVIGGYTHGIMGVEATTVGNDAEIKTIVHAGFAPDTYDKYLRLNRMEQTAQASLSDTVEAMTKLIREKKNGSQNSNYLEKKLEELNKQKDTFFTQLDQVRQDKEFLMGIIEKGRGAKVVIDGNLYRGTTVSVENLKLAIDHNTCYMKYYVENGELTGSVIIHFHNA